MKKRTTAIKVDLSKSLDDFLLTLNIEDSDCFTHEWEPSSIDCQKCADFNLCGNLFRKTTLSLKVKKLDNEQGPFLDEHYFDDIHRQSFYEGISVGTTTTSELFEIIKAISNCKSDEIIIKWLKVFLIEYELKAKKGIIIDGK